MKFLNNRSCAKTAFTERKKKRSMDCIVRHITSGIYQCFTRNCFTRNLGGTEHVDAYALVTLLDVIYSYIRLVGWLFWA